MGWYYTDGASRKDIITECTTGYTSETGTFCKALRHCCRGSVLYVLWEIKTINGITQRYIGIYLLRGHKDGWGYKPMDESMGPFYYECPLSYIEEAGPTEDKGSNQWRELVKRHHENKRAKRLAKDAFAFMKIPIVQ